MKHLGFASLAAVQQYLRYARDKQLDIQAALTASGISADAIHRERGRIRGEAFQTLIQHLMEQANDPLFGLHTSQQVQSRSYDLLGEMTLNCDTIGESMALIQPFEHLVGDMGVSTLSHRDGHVAIAWHAAYSIAHVRTQMIDNVLTSWTQYARWLMQQSPPIRLVQLERAQPAQAIIDEYQAFFRCPVKFGQARNAIIFPERIMAAPLLRKTDGKLAELTRQAEQEMARIAEPGQHFSIRVRHSIRKQLALGQVQKDLVACEFNMTARTLQRKLNQEGHTYQEMLDQVREEQAVDMLTYSTLDFQEIAYNLGFTDSRSFFRRFRVWRGESPGTFRSAINQAGLDTPGQ